MAQGRRARRGAACWSRTLALLGGCVLGQLYYIYLLKKIPFPSHISVILSLAISLLLGFGNLVSPQLRCISLLTLPMYCGKPGRGVLKAVVLTYVIAGPITNMGLNAKEVVRVFACSTQLSHNLTKLKYDLIGTPFKNALFDMRPEVSQVKDTIRPSFVEPKDFYQNIYLAKLRSRCESLLSRAAVVCMDILASVYDQCQEVGDSSWVLCWQKTLNETCNLKEVIGPDICDSSRAVNPGLGEGYVQLKKAKNVQINNKDVSLQYKLNVIRELYSIQDAKETGDRVMHAFEEKCIIMHIVVTTINVCVALLFLRIFSAAVTYHDEYLTDIEHDNVYVTGYFKRLDNKRKKKDKYSLLPLKKMERSKYVDVHSLRYKPSERDRLLAHVLKVTLEVVTATTFVMLDRLFFEALDVVRQHAGANPVRDGTRDLEVEVEGTGTLATMVRKVLGSLNAPAETAKIVTNKECLPRPHSMSPLFYFKIYGGYLWILLLLYVNPYTVRLRRLICSYFYHVREKQRILHLYNDILKKRMKMQKTLQKKAVQAVRAHYLSGENLLSLRIKFPRLLGWLQVFPAARMSCLICGETEPRNVELNHGGSGASWHSCAASKCPFVYCVECWQEAGARCLACDPSLADLSDVDSLSD